MEVASALILAVLSIIGVTELIRRLSMSFFGKKDSGIIYLIPIYSDTGDVEFAVREAIAQIKWRRTNRGIRAVCLDCGMSGESREICERLCGEYGFLKIMSGAELLENLGQHKEAEA